MSSQLLDAISLDHKTRIAQETRKLFATLIQPQQYVGDVYSMSYETALVLIHDHYRQKVGGIPSLSFLIATRVDPTQLVDYVQEDASVLLLRVMDSCPLPNASEAERVRVETAQRISGETDTHWDSSDIMDSTTHNLLSFAGVKCRIIGTFYVEKDEDTQQIYLKFGSDISNYYPNRGLKVYKPNAQALWAIVNYRDYIPNVDGSEVKHEVTIGAIRYASTNRSFQGVSDVAVWISPDDLLSQKTALFGMTRTGKSNTTKIMLQSIFGLRFDNSPLRIGQLVFDPNGEYANENVQDNRSAIRNIGGGPTSGQESDVVTYGLTPHPNDPNRRLMLLNFFEENNLQIGKEIIDSALASDSSIYIRNFCQIVFEKPDPTDHSASIRYNRRVFVYRALLAKAGFKPPTKLPPVSSKLFSQELLQYLSNSMSSSASDHQAAAAMLGKKALSWAQAALAMQYLYDFIEDTGSGYQQFEQWYINQRPQASGNPWADDDLKKLLTMFKYPNGSRLIGKVAEQHTDSTVTDYATEIYNHLVKGRLVIVDQSSGDLDINKSSAERIMWHVFGQNQVAFRHAHTPPDILVYIEEAHTLLPAGTDLDMKNVWVRTAKEGAKYRIGMVYATQEVSSIQRNILRNTANWFIGHLNNTDETKELVKYYDFEDFEASIRRAQDKGFLRVKTLSNLFVIPVQVKKFEV